MEAIIEKIQIASLAINEPKEGDFVKYDEKFARISRIHKKENNKSIFEIIFNPLN